MSLSNFLNLDYSAAVWRLYFDSSKLYSKFNNDAKITCTILFKCVYKNLHKMIDITFEHQFYFLITPESLWFTLSKDRDFFNGFGNPEKVTRSVVFLNRQPKFFLKFKIQTFSQYIKVKNFGAENPGVIYEFDCGLLKMEDNFLIQNELNVGEMIDLKKLLKDCSAEKNKTWTFPRIANLKDCVLLNGLRDCGFVDVDEEILSFKFYGNDFIELFNECKIKNNGAANSAFSCVQFVVCVFDIETRIPNSNGIHNKVPLANNGVITCASLLFYKTTDIHDKRSLRDVVIINMILFNGKNETKTSICNEVKKHLDGVKIDNPDDRIINLVYSSEYSLLLDFIRCVNASVSFLTGYNIDTYDLPFIYNSFGRYLSLSTDTIIKKNLYYASKKKWIEAEARAEIELHKTLTATKNQQSCIEDSEFNEFDGGDLDDSDNEQENLDDISDQVDFSEKVKSTQKSQELSKKKSFIVDNMDLYAAKFSTNPPTAITISKPIYSLKLDYDEMFWSNLPFSQSIDSMFGEKIKLNTKVKNVMSYSCEIISEWKIKIIDVDSLNISTPKSVYSNMEDILISGCFVCLELFSNTTILDSEIYEIKQFNSDSTLDLIPCALTSCKKTSVELKFCLDSTTEDEEAIGEVSYIIYPVKHEMSLSKNENLEKMWEPANVDEFAQLVSYCTFDVLLTRIIDCLTDNTISQLTICGAHLPLPFGAYLRRKTGYLACIFQSFLNACENLTFTTPNTIKECDFVDVVTNDNVDYVANTFVIKKFKTENCLDWVCLNDAPILDEYKLNTQNVNFRERKNNFFTVHQTSIEKTNELLDVLNLQNSIKELLVLCNKKRLSTLLAQQKKKELSVSWFTFFTGNERMQTFIRQHNCFKMNPVEVEHLVVTSKFNFENQSCFGVFFIQYQPEFDYEINILTRLMLGTRSSPLKIWYSAPLASIFNTLPENNKFTESNNFLKDFVKLIDNIPFKTYVEKFLSNNCNSSTSFDRVI